MQYEKYHINHILPNKYIAQRLSLSDLFFSVSYSSLYPSKGHSDSPVLDKKSGLYSEIHSNPCELEMLKYVPLGVKILISG